MKSTLLRAPNLDRSLPPTPISESPQVSRVVSRVEGAELEDILLFYFRSGKKASNQSPRVSSGKGW